VVNPVAGRGRTTKLLPRLHEAFDRHDVTMHLSVDAADGCRAAREAFGRGEGVVACGGDGTVSALAAEAAEADAPLAVVPTGAGNDFARHLGLDHRQAVEAIDLLATGHLQRIDLGRAIAADDTSYVFTTIANTGFDAEANRWANNVRRFTGTALYVAAVLRTIAVYRPRPISVRVDGEAWIGDAWLVAVGNTPWYAGGMKITPDAVTDDGNLDVCIIGGAPLRRFLANFPKVFKGGHVGMKEVTLLRGQKVELSTSDRTDPPLELWASGERVGPLPARLEAMPDALQVLVPPSTPTPR
jgi:diacylglycerol kinase (ATP)